MNLREIKSAVDSGRTVYVSNDNYTVIKDELGQYFINSASNNHNIGLTWIDGVTLNDKEENFFTKDWEKSMNSENELAESKGFTVGKTEKGSPSFSKGTRHVWWIMGRDLHPQWQTADLLDGLYRNHKKYEQLEEALDRPLLGD